MPTSATHYKIAEIGGDGIGPDVVAEAVRVHDLYAGVRPIKVYPGVPSPLAWPEGISIDYVIFRENTGGLFASLGGGSKVGEELAVNTLVITRKGTERIVRRAFETCQERAARLGSGVSKVTSVDKANVFRSDARAAAAAGDRIEAAVAKALREPGARTRDIGGHATTRTVGEAVIRAL